MQYHKAHEMPTYRRTGHIPFIRIRSSSWVVREALRKMGCVPWFSLYLCPSYRFLLGGINETAKDKPGVVQQVAGRKVPFACYAHGTCRLFREIRLFGGTDPMKSLCSTAKGPQYAYRKERSEN